MRSTTPSVAYARPHVVVVVAPADASHPRTSYIDVNASSVTFFTNEYTLVLANNSVSIPNCSTVSRYSANDTLDAPTRRCPANIENRRLVDGTGTPRASKSYAYTPARFTARSAVFKFALGASNSSNAANESDPVER